MSLSELRLIGITVRTSLEVLRAQTQTYWNPSLNGACAVGAYTVAKLAQRAGFKCQFVLSENEVSGHCWTEEVSGHCWTEVELNGQVIVVDTTATQFSGRHPKVVIEPVYRYYASVWDPLTTKVYRGIPALRRVRSWWPENQLPQTYLSQLSVLTNTPSLAKSARSIR